MNKRIERGKATREQLIEIATRLFAERGYDGTSIETVLQESGLSRGALYHHFNGKEALFEAVLAVIQTDVGRKTLSATRTEQDPLAALRAGCVAWIQLAGDPVVRQIMLIDAPSVMGWQRWREYDEKLVLGIMKTWMTTAAEQGVLPAEQSDLFAHVVMAAVNEIALVTARADDHDDAIRVGTAALDEILRRLLDV
jgi:AcrR family transcriptional regulator